MSQGVETQSGSCHASEAELEHLDGLRRQIEALSTSNATLADNNAELQRQLQQWKHEAQRLEQALQRILDQRKTPREHVDPNQVQLAFEQTAKQLLDVVPPRDPAQAQQGPKPKGPRNRTPHGRGMLTEHLPVETIVFTPKDLPEGARKIGEDVSWRLGFRRASFYRLKVVRPRFVVDSDQAAGCQQTVGYMIEATSDAHAPQPYTQSSTEASAEQPTLQSEASEPVDTTVVQATVPREIIDRGLPTADLLSHIIVSKFADNLPYNRQESIYGRQGVTITRSAMCQWAGQAHELATGLVKAMQTDARHHADVISTDSTGVLVQANERCKKGYFWVYVSNNGHVIFRYSTRNVGEEPKSFFSGYKGTVLADATSTLDAICKLPDNERAGCHSHARRYFFKAIESDRDRALVGLGLYNRLFELERQWHDLPPSRRLALRQEHCRPVFEALLRWCDEQLPLVDGRSPIRAAIHYTTNNRVELGCFLLNGKVPIHNNRSELELRRLVVGRAAWLFVGSDDSAPWTCTFSSLVASCAMHRLDPASYLRDLFRVLPHWPATRLLELCPRDWTATRARLDPAELALPLGPLTVPPLPS